MAAAERGERGLCPGILPQPPVRHMSHAKMPWTFHVPNPSTPQWPLLTANPTATLFLSLRIPDFILLLCGHPCCGGGGCGGRVLILSRIQLQPLHLWSWGLRCELRLVERSQQEHLLAFEESLTREDGSPFVPGYCCLHRSPKTRWPTHSWPVSSDSTWKPKGSKVKESMFEMSLSQPCTILAPDFPDMRKSFMFKSLLAGSYL